MEDFFEKIKKRTEPPNTDDIFHVQDSLKEQQIIVQGNACLQQSIAQE